MGFYAPAQLVREVRRQGVEVRPVDVRHSAWDCSLEPDSKAAPALRLGLRMVKGLSVQGAERLLAARRTAPLGSVQDLGERAGLGRRDLQALAAAGAFAGIAGNRHQAGWQVAAVEPQLPLFAGLPPELDRHPPEPLPLLPNPSEGETIVADYASLGLSLGRHPLALLRGHLNRRRLLPAEQVRRLPHGAWVRTAGLVINRQRPSSANSVTFITLEDETEQLNLIVWKRLAERQRKTMLGARLLGVVGELQREGRVIHVVAQRLEDHSELLGGLVTRSRDFR
jgi:error-prone DNA polymerase